jgi:hypothetical protein
MFLMQFLEFAIALHILPSMFGLYRNGTFFMDTRPKYFSQIFHDEVANVLGSYVVWFSSHMRTEEISSKT